MRRRRRGGGGSSCRSKRDPRARPLQSGGPSRAAAPGLSPLWEVRPGLAAKAPLQWRDGDVAAAPARARGLGADVPPARARERADAARDRRDRRDRAPDRSGPRLPALAGLHGGRSAARERLPLLHRVLEPDRRGRRDPRHARDLARGAARADASKRWVRWVAGRDVPRHARARRRSARSPSTTTSTRGSCCRTSCSRSAILSARRDRRARGVGRARRAGAARRSRGSRCVVGARVRRARRHRRRSRPPPGRTPGSIDACRAVGSF